MTIEEKAKAYDEALERAKKLYNEAKANDYTSDMEDYETIFPELKESENEKAKRIILALPFKHEADYKFVKIWLEKQGDCSAKWEKNTADNKPALNHSVLMKNIHGIAEGEWNGKEWIQYKWSSKIKDSDVLNWMELYELEKLGEQKTAEFPKDYHDIDPHFGIHVEDLMPKEKPADKVEPKFKTGQWIVWQDKYYKVNYNGCGYELIDQNGLSTSLEYGTVEESAYLWDISDAKDGDVLYSPCCKLLWIYKDDKSCYVGNNLNYCSNYAVINEHILIPTDAIPATKEQRDLLFTKMKEAGYAFDFEKKELKKIEQKPVEDKDAERASADYRNFRMSCGINDPVMLDEIEEAYYEGAISRKSAEWSEGDERIIDNLISELANLCTRKLIKEGTKYKYVNWLKSLKDRVQPKQEWSEEDEKMYKTALSCIETLEDIANGKNMHADVKEWLKSIKDRMQGKEEKK